VKDNLNYLHGLVLYGSFPGVLDSCDVLLERLGAVAREQAFQVVELPLVEDASAWPEIGRILRGGGLRAVASLGPSIVRSSWNLASLDTESREEAVHGARLGIDYAYALGARTLVVMSGRDPGPEHRPEAREALETSLGQVFDYARERAGEYLLQISLEPADRDLAHHQLVGPSVEAARLASRMRRVENTFGLTLDMSHVAQLGETVEHAVTCLKESVTHAHLANAVVRDSAHPQYGDQHPPFDWPGSEYQAHDIGRFMRLLFQHSFKPGASLPYGRPVISLEVKPPPGSDEELILAGAMRAVVRAGMLPAPLGGCLRG